MKTDVNDLPDNDPLDARLREANDYIADNGFTARVMTSLPPRRRRRWGRRLILSVATLLGAALTACWMPSANDMLAAVSFGSGQFKAEYLFSLLPVFAAAVSIFGGLLAIAREE
jgi:hypothetical protein